MIDVVQRKSEIELRFRLDGERIGRDESPKSMELEDTEIELRFLLDGERIGRDETSESMELEDQDQIDCVIVQGCCHAGRGTPDCPCMLAQTGGFN